MRLPRARFTVRRLMASVAILAVLMGGALWVGRMMRLSELYRQGAAFYARLAEMNREGAARTARFVEMHDEAIASASETVAPTRLYLEELHRLREAELKTLRVMRESEARYAARKRKYEYAASHPWLPLPLDPHERPWWDDRPVR